MKILVLLPVLASVLVSALFAGPAHAQYKCTTLAGSVTYQQAACPNTQKQLILHARPAPPEAGVPPAATPPGPLPRKSPDVRAARVVGQPEDEARAFAAGAGRIESDLARLEAVRLELGASRKLALR